MNVKHRIENLVSFINLKTSSETNCWQKKKEKERNLKANFRIYSIAKLFSIANELNSSNK